jgi:hypothetical protein
LAPHVQDGLEATRRMVADENHGYPGVDNLAVAREHDLGHRRNAAIKELTHAFTL